MRVVRGFWDFGISELTLTLPKNEQPIPQVIALVLTPSSLYQRQVGVPLALTPYPPLTRFGVHTYPPSTPRQVDHAG